MGAEFTHLHLHTDYSLLDGACDVDKLVAHVDKIGQKSVAMTDHGNIFGAVHFFNSAKKKGIKPILGCELYICQAEDHRAKGDGDKYNHLLVLAENQEGYRNLVRLTSEAALHGFYRKPRVSKNFLAKHTEGLIGFSGCLAGEVSQHLMAGDYDKAKTTAGGFEEMFGRGNFFLEVQDHKLAPDKAVIEAMFRMEKDLDIPLIATNDSHYIEDQDARAHEVLLCVQTAGSMNDPKRFKFDTEEFYIKTAEEMARFFPDHPEVLSRTMQFPERCNLELNKVDNPFPDFPVPAGETLESYFEQVCREGLKKRFETNVAHLERTGKLRKNKTDYEARLNREIDCIKAMKFPGYFMIVWDFIRYAREQGIPVGPGRGSAAGSLVAYCMEITDVDPLQNELLFERFLNPERISMPDIDIDFCMNRRGEVIEYVQRKYGKDQVAQIITFNTMAAKAAIKDVGRALDMPYGEVDRIAKMIQGRIGVTISEVLKDNGPLTKAYESEPQIRELIDTALRLEGLVRGAGVHAAGVVIAPSPLTELVPVTRAKSEEIVTSYDMGAIEKMGLLKMDFLGLTTLTVIDDALKLIKLTRGEDVDLATISLDDAKTYEQVFHRALTSGVFQFESGGMRDVLRRYKPNTVEDLTALNALYRPGPIQGGMVDEFIERKWGRRAVEYELPELEPILRETLGVMLYQEQVMQISNKLAGFSLSQADMLRRAMGKKDVAEMTKQKVKFMEGAAENKHPKAVAGNIFDLMAKFAEYGFNKSHSAAYALLAYHTAYLKTHYTVEFMAALLTSETSKPENVVKYISECKEINIAVVPPDVQISQPSFTPQDGAIRFGLAAIKNVGHNAIQSIIDARGALQAEGKDGFASLWEFCEKVDLRLLNKRVLESLIKAGAMDCFGKRAAVMAALDNAMDRAQKAQKDKAAGQHGLFFGGIFDSDVPAAGAAVEALPNAPEWDEHTRLQNEKDVLGFFVSGHPMDKYREKLRNMKVVDTATACEMKPEPQQFRRGGPEPNEISIAGVITGLKVAKSKRSGEMYAQAVLEDTTGKIELICFPQSYEKMAEKLKITVPVVIRGSLRGEEDSAPKLAISGIEALEDVKLRLPEALRIKVPLHSSDAELLNKLARLFTESPGRGKLLLDFEEPGEFCAVLEPMKVMVAADRLFIDRVEELVGRGAVRVIQ
ncbi:DNA polymerase III subunit alpha [Granulicella tundricola]|uniref:DNA polymerase III subunit alpha n=1 Tax=Granulicella tundricola (strain ATCC BAA-1859 / DSM 23138 / MP5ACTX9) TaxID=1198114 RepID=E8X2M1_GRATM|nr:DNA polymerase III subunit alpha [Granulicella tundricola]ADW69245.1 DNA polymerase III, alpha subunit [Granulicella tundricola MP5ACTX9]